MGGRDEDSRLTDDRLVAFAPTCPLPEQGAPRYAPTGILLPAELPFWESAS